MRSARHCPRLFQPLWLAGALMILMLMPVAAAVAQTPTAAPTATAPTPTSPAAPTECEGEPDDPAACREDEGAPDDDDGAVPAGGVDTGAGGTVAPPGVERGLVLALGTGCCSRSREWSGGPDGARQALDHPRRG